MKQKKYNEFRVDSFKREKGLIVTDKWGNPVIQEKRLTSRGSVMIHDHEADLNNSNVLRTKLFYELSEVQPEEKNPIQERNDMMAKAAEMGLKVAKNITNKKLKELINQ